MTDDVSRQDVSESAEADAEARAQAALTRLPPKLRDALAWLFSRWPGRILVRSAETCGRIQVFDRAMTIAAQFFTSVFPILILLATWTHARDVKRVSDAVDLPSETQSVLGRRPPRSQRCRVRRRGCRIRARVRDQPVAGPDPCLRRDLGAVPTQDQPRLRLAMARGRPGAGTRSHRGQRAARLGQGHPTARRVADRAVLRLRLRRLTLRAVGPSLRTRPRAAPGTGCPRLRAHHERRASRLRRLAPTCLGDQRRIGTGRSASRSPTWPGSTPRPCASSEPR